MSSEASVELAALFVTWSAVALLVVIAGNLHVRLRRLEHAGRDLRPAPYGHLLGRKLADILDSAPGTKAPRVLFFLSKDCSSCSRLLEELASPSWKIASAIVWTDDAPPAQPPPPHIPILAYGSKLGADLGVGVKPFALIADADGTVVKAGPVASLRSLGDMAVDGDVAVRRQPVLDHA